MVRRLLLIVLAVIFIAIIGLFVIAWRPSIAPIAAPAATEFPSDLIAKGEMLAGAGYCATCHTAPGGVRNAGGFPMETGFGTIYSTNITPDLDTGIGSWSEAAFARAMHEGVARDGSHLFPAFPFDHFTKVTNEDIKALYAYLMTRAPVRAENRSNEIPFPLNVRALQAGWKLLFLKKGVYEPDPAKSEEWNRGAYLAEGLSHCGACHTPRNSVGAEKRDAAYAGAFIGDWEAPALDGSNPAPVAWNVEELTTYLRTGSSALHGSATGKMSEVIHDGLAALPDSDIRAIATYFADINGAHDKPVDAAIITAALNASAQGTRHDTERGSGLYLSACAACHYSGQPGPQLTRPDLALNTALNSADPSNFIQVVLHGISASDGIPDLMMPGFAHLSDAEIAVIGAYLRRTRTSQPPWPDLNAKIAKIRYSKEST